MEPSLETAGALSVRIAHGPIWMTQPGAGGEARATSTLLDNVAAAKFVYFGTFDEAVPPQWHETWEHPTRLPSLVAVDTRFAPGDPRQWHRLVIQITAADSSSVRCPPRSTCR
ncbi:hypothetical protein EGT07_37705 [Herbaspirillum sp. HC18]|nr:hypothetical protein EGT07_37705 [Herbaspirillum sp. HC18]